MPKVQSLLLFIVSFLPLLLFLPLCEVCTLILIPKPNL